jgi:hypothetical protein
MQNLTMSILNCDPSHGRFCRERCGHRRDVALPSVVTLVFPVLKSGELTRAEVLVSVRGGSFCGVSSRVGPGRLRGT